jgi:hypothetical protein
MSNPPTLSNQSHVLESSIVRAYDRQRPSTRLCQTRQTRQTPTVQPCLTSQASRISRVRPSRRSKDWSVLGAPRGRGRRWAGEVHKLPGPGRKSGHGSTPPWIK